ncbi:MAG TPA: cyclodeaminase/cyclohydrolase family protein [bacterium]|nr:cyclodeaminase/cyclohydrolase family protein [bacterium]
MYDYLSRPLEEYLNQLAAKLPCPGGGSVVALTAALSAALTGMVVNYTLGKKGYQEYQKELEEIRTRLEAQRQRLQKIVEEDSNIYEKIQQASKEKSPALEGYLKESATLHLSIAREALSLLKTNFLLLNRGNRYLLSDVGIAAVLAEAAFRAASINAAINFKYLKDTSFVQQGCRELEELSQEIFSLSRQIEEGVRRSLQRKE